MAPAKRPPKLSTDLSAPENVIEPGTPGNLDRVFKVKVGNSEYDVTPENVEIVSLIGRGAFGVVEHVKHKESGHDFALKRISINMTQEQKKQLRDMEVLLQVTDCRFIVTYFGSIYWEGDVWIFMQLMDASLDQFYKMVYKRVKEEDRFIPENVLGYMAFSIVKALHFLHSIKIIHRDVKPSNILTNRQGDVKLCDFGISGYLENSVAKTFEAGCKPYMAPERINPQLASKGYDIRSDVWSLGITMCELSIGKFPYKEVPGNVFAQLKQICNDDPPRLPDDSERFSPEYQDFIVQCLQKNYEKRPNYATLLQHAIIVKYQEEQIADYICSVLDVQTP